MNALLTAAEIGVSYAFPQVGATLLGYKAVKLTYNIGKVVLGAFSGDPTIAYDVAKLAGRAALASECEELRDQCIKATMSIQSGIGTGCGIVGCHAAYMLCKWFA